MGFMDKLKEMFGGASRPAQPTDTGAPAGGRVAGTPTPEPGHERGGHEGGHSHEGGGGDAGGGPAGGGEAGGQGS